MPEERRVRELPRRTVQGSKKHPHGTDFTRSEGSIAFNLIKLLHRLRNLCLECYVQRDKPNSRSVQLELGGNT